MSLYYSRKQKPKQKPVLRILQCTWALLYLEKQSVTSRCGCGCNALVSPSSPHRQSGHWGRFLTGILIHQNVYEISYKILNWIWIFYLASSICICFVSIEALLPQFFLVSAEALSKGWFFWAGPFYISWSSQRESSGEILQTSQSCRYCWDGCEAAVLVWREEADDSWKQMGLPFR